MLKGRMGLPQSFAAGTEVLTLSIPMTTTPISCQAAKEQQLCVSANYLGTAGAAEIETLPLYIFIKIVSSLCALNWERVKAEMQITLRSALIFLFFFLPTFSIH